MARNINPTPQYLDGNGNPIIGGKMYYFVSGTNTALITYADNESIIPNTHPVILDASGRLPNVFFAGSCKQILEDADGVQIWEKDPVGGENTDFAFSLYDSLTIYDVSDIVKGSDGLFYISITANNQGNDPTTTPANWTEIRFIKMYNSVETYSQGEIVQDSVGDMYKSLVSSNLGNTPGVDQTKWTSAYAEQPVLIHSGGGNLTALRINMLTDSGAYTLPLANSISDGEYIEIDLPDRYSSFEPVVSIAGSDTITDISGTDTSITFNTGASIGIRLVSDGVTNWTL